MWHNPHLFVCCNSLKWFDRIQTNLLRFFYSTWKCAPTVWSKYILEFPIPKHVLDHFCLYQFVSQQLLENNLKEFHQIWTELFTGLKVVPCFFHFWSERFGECRQDTPLHLKTYTKIIKYTEQLKKHTTSVSVFGINKIK